MGDSDKDFVDGVPREDVFVVKAHLFNVLVPVFFKNFFFGTVVALGLFLVNLFGLKVLDLGFEGSVWWFVGFVVVFAVVFLIDDVVKINLTEYRFYDKYLEIYYSFVSEKVHTVYYNQINEIVVKRNLWDRFFDVGDLVLICKGAGPGQRTVLKDLERPFAFKQEIGFKINPVVKKNLGGGGARQVPVNSGVRR